MTVVAVDLMRRLPLDFVLLPKGRGERAGAQQLAEHFRPGDVAVMDRGFPARWLLADFLGRGVDVVVRMTAAKADSWPEIVVFMKSGKTSAVVDIRIDAKRTMPMRLIRRNFRRGRPLGACQVNNIGLSPSGRLWLQNQVNPPGETAIVQVHESPTRSHH